MKTKHIVVTALIAFAVLFAINKVDALKKIISA